jgi:WD40 repeat protein
MQFLIRNEIFCNTGKHEVISIFTFTLLTSILHSFFRGHTAPIWAMDISDSGSMLVTGSMDTTARIWLPESTEYVRILVGHYFDVDVSILQCNGIFNVEKPPKCVSC